MNDDRIAEDDETVPLRCSARGCSHDAEFALRWNNVKIHPPERRKTWLACTEHEVPLTEYLSVRGLFRERDLLTNNVGKATPDASVTP